MSTKPQMGDMYACQKCSAQIQIIQGCDCEMACAEFRCCDEAMKNITEPTVRDAADTEAVDGYENSSKHESIPMPIESIAEQVEKAKKI